MLRSRHLYGYLFLTLAVLGLSWGWWYDHSSSEARIVILNGEVDHLVGMLRRKGENIERMAGGGFRRIYLSPGFKLPPGYTIDKNAPLQTVPFTRIGARVDPPDDHSEPLSIRR